MSIYPKIDNWELNRVTKSIPCVKKREKKDETIARANSIRVEEDP